MTRVFFFLLLIPQLVISQQDKQENDGGVSVLVGGNIGFYLPNHNPSLMYNGQGVHNLSVLWQNPQIVQEIETALGHEFYFGEYPEQVRYNPSILVGGRLNFLVAKNWEALLEANFIQLKSENQFTLIYEDPSQPNTVGGQVINPQTIQAKEDRVNFNAGVQRFFGENENLKPFLQTGLDVTGVQTESVMAFIEGYTYSIFNNNLQNSAVAGQVQPANRFKFAVGGFFGGGIRLDFSDSFAFDLATNLAYQKIQLGTYEEYDPYFTLYLTILHKGNGKNEN